MTVKQFCKTVCFLLVAVILYFSAQEIFMPEWNQNCGCGNAISGFHALEEDSVDALFLGTSLVSCGISPMKIYEDTKVCTYNLGTSTQSIQASYYLLKNAFLTQKPKVVFLEPSNFFYKIPSSFFYRIVMDNLYFTEEGFEMALEYDRLYGEGIVSSLFPMTTYHSRWNEVDTDDFHMRTAEPYHSMGYYMVSHTAPIDEDVLAIYDSHTEIWETSEREELYPTITEDVHRFFGMILELCRENGAELIVMKMPSFRSVLHEGWSPEHEAAVLRMCSDSGVEYYDMYGLASIDVTKDTRDGIHMHITGAEKVSAHLGQFLLENVPDLDTSGNALYDSQLEPYGRIRAAAQLQAQTDFTAYLQMLQAHEDEWSFAVAGAPDDAAGLTEQQIALLRQMGLSELENIRSNENYGAVLEKGNVRFQKRSEQFVTTTVKLKEGGSVQLTAANAYDIAVEEKETAVTRNGSPKGNWREGLNFLVWDNETGLSIDAKTFSVGTESSDCYSDLRIIKGYLRDFENAVAYGK